MLITSGKVLPKELRISLTDVKKIVDILTSGENNCRVKGLDSDVVFYNNIRRNTKEFEVRPEQLEHE